MRKKLSDERRISAVTEYRSGKGSYTSIASKYQISIRTLQDMVARYDSQGIEGLRTQQHNKKYSKELKQQAIAEYLSGKCSQQEICKKYKIQQRSQLRMWIKMYNGHKEIKATRGAGTEIYMTKGRKTTQQERAEIVAFCIEHSKDYPLTIQTYGVSYQQIYAWVQKYEIKGVDGLTDGRGRTKPEAEMTENEKLRAENKILQAKLKDKEMELALIKKLKELEEGGH